MIKTRKPPGLPKIGVRNLQRKIRVDLTALQLFAERALAQCLDHHSGNKTQLRQLAEISVLLISDQRMIDLHRRFLNESRATDVITFDHGEIFISLETARRHARTFKSTFLRETQLYIVHGLLHLHGFDDQNQAGAREMGEIQEKILGKLFVQRRGGKRASIA